MISRLHEFLGLHKARNALILTIVVCAVVVDISGTPVAVWSLTRAESNFNKSTGQTIHARYDDCAEAEVLRHRGRQRAVKEEHELLTNLALLHLKPTAVILKKAHEVSHAARHQLAPKDCYAYAHRAEP